MISSIFSFAQPINCINGMFLCLLGGEKTVDMKPGVGE